MDLWDFFESNETRVKLSNFYVAESEFDLSFYYESSLHFRDIHMNIFKYLYTSIAFVHIRILSICLKIDEILVQTQRVTNYKVH